MGLGLGFGAVTSSARHSQRASRAACFFLVVPLGLIALHWTPMLHLAATAARITVLVVGREARRQGLGRRLIGHAIGLARAAGSGSLELTTATHRAEAHAFYRATGFVQTSVRFQVNLAN